MILNLASFASAKPGLGALGDGQTPDDAVFEAALAEASAIAVKASGSVYSLKTAWADPMTASRLEEARLDNAFDAVTLQIPSPPQRYILSKTLCIGPELSLTLVGTAPQGVEIAMQLVAGAPRYAFLVQ